MTTVGVICEYNPFHNGHKKQFHMIKEQFGPETNIICLMSGNFVQRGEPAIFDKFVRSKAAVLCGADLVLELPVTLCVSSAEAFAGGAVKILNDLNIINYLCFGSECGDINKIIQTAKLLSSSQYESVLHEELKKGVSFPAARQSAIKKLGYDADILSSPNDILAVEYCKALLKLHSEIKPFCLKRQGGYSDITPEKDNPSALSLRSMPCSAIAEYVPTAAAEVFLNSAEHRIVYGERSVLAVLRSMTDAEFEELPYGSEGLWRKFRLACFDASSIEEIIQKTKSKRYTRTRICRMLLCAYLGISQKELNTLPDYVRILSANDNGTKLIRKIRKQECMQLINAGQAPIEKEYYRLECRCSDLYSLFIDKAKLPACRSEQEGRIFLKKCEKNACNPQNVVVI